MLHTIVNVLFVQQMLNVLAVFSNITFIPLKHFLSKFVALNRNIRLHIYVLIVSYFRYNFKTVYKTGIRLFDPI